MRCARLILLLALPAAAQQFSFWQLSDTHIPVPGTGAVIEAAGARGAMRLEPFGIDAPAPEFAIVTGDVFEFGPGAGAWERWRQHVAGWAIPLHLTPGNHDNTWWTLRPRLRELTGTLPYAFEHQGCRFIFLDTAGRQDPRPAVALEELDWLRGYLAGVTPETPLFIAFHHPLGGSEWASAYDYERLIELLQPYHVVLMLVGHHHSHVAGRYGRFDAVIGGSTFDKNVDGWAGGEAGHMVYDLRDGRLRAAYRRHAEERATLALLDKPLARPAMPAAPAIIEPAADAAADAPVRLVAEDAFGAGATATVALDEGEPVAAVWRDGRWRAELDLREALPGRHVLRLRVDHDGLPLLASREFEVARAGGPRALWRTRLDGSVRAPLAVLDDTVYAASQPGTVYAIDRASGAVRWTAPAGGEIFGGLAVDAERVYVTATDGGLTALSHDGARVWRYDAGQPIVAPPTLAGGVLYFGTIDGQVHAVRDDGTLVWARPTADYTIESAACVADGRVYLGAWDTHVYCLDAGSGELLWQATAAGADGGGGAARYYSPADAPPVVVAGRLLVADRNYRLTILDAAGGERLGTQPQVGAVGRSADGAAAYLRQYGQDGRRLTRLDGAGATVWSVELPGGSLPVQPVESEGLVAFTSDTGVISLVDAATGALHWQYRSNAGHYLSGGAQVRGGVVYAAGLDGMVVAVRP